MNKLKDIIPDLFSSFAEATYSSYIEAFMTHFANHASKINGYYIKLRHISDRKYDIRFAFLIEIHTSFSALFLHKGEDTIVNRRENAPIIDGYIRIVKEMRVKASLIMLSLVLAGLTLFRMQR